MGEVVLGETLLAATRQTFEVDLLCLAKRGSMSQDFLRTFRVKTFECAHPTPPPERYPPAGAPPEGKARVDSVICESLRALHLLLTANAKNCTH